MSENSFKIKKRLLYWLFPKTDEIIDAEINRNNIKNVRYLCLAISLVQLLSLVAYVLLHLNSMGDMAHLVPAFHVFLSIVICMAMFLLTTYIIKNKKSLLCNNTVFNIIIIIMMTAIIIWSEYVSVKHYISNSQMMTFFTAELCVALFLKMRPVISISVITLSSASFYIYLILFVKASEINPYNYAMFFAILVASAVQSYRHTVNNIKQRRRIKTLNENLQIVANHDIMTRLNNRYSLNQRIGEIRNTDICVAMIDINKFKSINDTYGHVFGDKVLKLAADRMLELFNKNNCFRYGGDEFLVFEETRDLEAFTDKLRSMNKKLEKSIIDDVAIPVQCCFGCVQAEVKEPKDFSELISVADKRLYDEKRKHQYEACVEEDSQ